MSRDNSRLIMELDKHRREVNHEQINPTLPVADMSTLAPVVRVCAKARADYIKCLMEIANMEGDGSCSPDQIEQLRLHRLAYEELISASNALETVIKRDYVNVNES